MEVRGQIDAGVASGAISAFRFPDPKDAYPWAWQNAIEVTSLLINTKHIRLSPEPLANFPPTEPYGPVTKKLSLIIDYSGWKTSVVEDAEKQTREWVNKNVPTIRKIYLRLRDDHRGYGTWLEWVITNSWHGHCKRKGGVCDKVFLKEVANVLNVDEDEIRRIQQISSDSNELNLAISGKAYKDEFDLMIDSFVVSGIIRGRYYGAGAVKTGSQFLCHQLRREVFSQTEQTIAEEYPLSNTERYLSSIIVSSAFRESDYRMRISEWLDSVTKARNANIEGKVDLRFKDFDDIAVDEAVRVAKMLDIRTQSKWIDKGINAGIALGVGILTSFVLSPWPGFLFGAASGAISDRLTVGTKIAAYSETKRRLGDLATAHPGNISRSWSGGLTLSHMQKETPDNASATDS